jgi:hypothetical protein
MILIPLAVLTLILAAVGVLHWAPAIVVALVLIGVKTFLWAALSGDSSPWG